MAWPLIRQRPTGTTPTRRVRSRGVGISSILACPCGCSTRLAYARQHLGARAGRDQWLVADVRIWAPGRRYRVWHDRAVFHFLIIAEERRQYLDVLESATEPGALAVFGCFAPDGPRQCSGLPVARYAAHDLAGELGRRWTLISQDREEHHTPAGAIQPFTWAALRRQP